MEVIHLWESSSSLWVCGYKCKEGANGIVGQDRKDTSVAEGRCLGREESCLQETNCKRKSNRKRTKAAKDGKWTRKGTGRRKT